MKQAVTKKQKGAILVFMAISIAVLIGIAALATDLGRLFVLKTQMQNAVDAAALAAAAELNGMDNVHDGGRGGAMERARQAARNLLEHKSGLVNDEAKQQLLEDLTDENFIFYCYIGDPNTTLEGSCDASSPVPEAGGTGKYLASSDKDAHYVRVTLNERRIDLYFLPVLGVLPGVTPPSESSTVSTAVAGRRLFFCEYNPLMMCDPFEDGNIQAGIDNIYEAVDQQYGGFAPDGTGIFDPGQVVAIKAETSASQDWGPGDFGYLLPGESGNWETGAGAVGDAIALRSNQVCSPALVHTRTGVITAIDDALDSIFDVGTYTTSEGESSTPASNVVNYPPWDPYNETNDGNFEWLSWVGGQRFGNAEWGREDYWTHYHDDDANPLTPAPLPPTSLTVSGETINWSDVTRWDMYRYEIENSGKLPCAVVPPPYDGVSSDTWVDGKGDDITVNCGLTNPLYDNTGKKTDQQVIPKQWETVISKDMGPSPSYADGKSSVPPISSPDWDEDRRMFYVAVVECGAQDLKGSTEAQASAIAKFFILRDAPDPAAKFTFIGEFVGLAAVGTDVVHSEVVLYE